MGLPKAGFGKHGRAGAPRHHRRHGLVLLGHARSFANLPADVCRQRSTRVL